jgi:hypothetical protein
MWSEDDSVQRVIGLSGSDPIDDYPTIFSFAHGFNHQLRRGFLRIASGRTAAVEKHFGYDCL